MDVADIPAGLQTPAWLRTVTDEATITAEAATRGMQLAPLSRYYQKPPLRTGFLLGFAASSPSAIARGCRDLAGIIRRHA